MSYVKPQDAVSPVAHLTMIAVLYDNGPGEDASAVIEWDGERRIGTRYNGDDDHNPAGHPQSHGHATWFVQPPQFNEGIIACLPEKKQALATALLDGEDRSIIRRLEAADA
jgi:hypothetical protein